MEMTSLIVSLAALGLLMIVLGGRSAAEARNARRLNAIDRKLRAIMEHLGVPGPAPELVEVVSHLEQGNKIQAIKVYREKTGAGLAQAKSEVEALARQLGLS